MIWGRRWVLRRALTLWMGIDVDKMNTGRRRFLGGLLAAGLAPAPSWADAGSPAYLAAAGKPDGSYALCGISAALDIVFEIPLPVRGHAAAGHPTRPEAVAFARRPGTVAMVIDCVKGAPKATLRAPEGRHFYGHGAFSADGAWLFTTENDFNAGRGVIGVWDVAAGYRRVNEFDSGGVGPHDIKRMPASDVLVIANGGIDTHPESGRTKLNIPTMQPNLSYVEDGRVTETVSLPADLHKNSIRHLDVTSSGDVAFGMQWQGGASATSLVGLHKRGQAMVLLDTPDDDLRRLDGYIGSIAFSKDGRSIAATSPRGGVLHLYDARNTCLKDSVDLEDVCGVAPHSDGFTVTSGTGLLCGLRGQNLQSRSRAKHAWDNHLVLL